MILLRKIISEDFESLQKVLYHFTVSKRLLLLLFTLLLHTSLLFLPRLYNGVISSLIKSFKNAL